METSGCEFPAVHSISINSVAAPDEGCQPDQTLCEQGEGTDTVFVFHKGRDAPAGDLARIEAQSAAMPGVVLMYGWLQEAKSKV